MNGCNIDGQYQKTKKERIILLLIPPTSAPYEFQRTPKPPGESDPCVSTVACSCLYL